MVATNRYSGRLTAAPAAAFGAGTIAIMFQ
jgi:hypothetical protein